MTWKFFRCFTLACGLSALAAPEAARATVLINNGIFTTTSANPKTAAIPLPLIGSALLGLDTNYLLTFSITDETIPQSSFYSGLLGGNPLALSSNGQPAGTFTGSVVLRDGPNPAPISLVITNLFQTQNPTLSPKTDAFFLTVTEAAAPEPASLAILGSGLAMAGLLRRRRLARA